MFPRRSPRNPPWICISLLPFLSPLTSHGQRWWGGKRGREEKGGRCSSGLLPLRSAANSDSSGG